MAEHTARENEKEEFWQLVSVITYDVVTYYITYTCKEPCMTASYTRNALLRELMGKSTGKISCYQMFRMNRIVCFFLVQYRKQYSIRANDLLLTT